MTTAAKTNAPGGSSPLISLIRFDSESGSRRRRRPINVESSATVASIVHYCLVSWKKEANNQKREIDGCSRERAVQERERERKRAVQEERERAVQEREGRSRERERERERGEGGGGGGHLRERERTRLWNFDGKKKLSPFIGSIAADKQSSREVGIKMKLCSNFSVFVVVELF